MLILLDYLVKKYDMKVKGIIHIGAHQAEEAPIYDRLNIKNVIWIEANPFIMNSLQKIISKYPNHTCYNYAIYSENDKMLNFNITNNGESSSLLNLKTHLIEHPHIFVSRQTMVPTKRMDTLIEENCIDMQQYNFINLDIQGTELLALKGCEKMLNCVDYVYTEVNNDYLYENGALVDELDEYLNQYGFKRVETSWTQHKWGDALYVKMGSV